MVQACIAILAIVILAIMSLRANQQLRTESRLPMQWSISGSVNWTAPRALALAFTPALGTIILAGATIATIAMPPRPGQEGLEAPVITFMSVCLVAAHALHLWLIRKSFKPNGS